MKYEPAFHKVEWESSLNANERKRPAIIWCIDYIIFICYAICFLFNIILFGSELKRKREIELIYFKKKKREK